MTGVDHATPGMILLLVLIIGPVLYYIWRARRGDELYVRRIAGIDAVDEAVGRAAELGRPVSFSTGLTKVSPVLYACLGVLSYVAKKNAVYRSKLIVPQNDPESMVIVEDTVRDAYRAAGRVSSFDPGSIVFLSESQFAFASGYMGIVHRERVAAAFLFGYFAAESLILAEAGQQVGAMQVGASVSPEQVCFFICTCDYTLIGEELYASSAYLSREPVQLGSLAAQDYGKLIIFLIIVAGVLFSSLESFYEMDLPNLIEIISASWEEVLTFFGGVI